MQYSKTEKYVFRFPQEYEAYREFKHQLNDIGVRFLEYGGSSTQVITIRASETFDVKDGKVFFSK